MLALRRIEKALGKTDPAGAESFSVRGKHQILGRQGAVFDDPRTWRAPRNQDEHRCVIEDLEAWIVEHRIKVDRKSVV